MSTKVTLALTELRRQFDAFSVNTSTVDAFIHRCVKSNDERRALDKTYLSSLIVAGKAVLDEDSAIPRAAVRNLIAELNEALNQNIDAQVFDPLWRKLIRQLRALGSCLLFVFVCYLVLGGVWSGESGLADQFNRWTVYAALAFLIIALAMLEGTQLSVTALKLKDLERVKQRFPRAHRLHKTFNTDASTKRYLAGRQMLVIVIVFCIAQLLSFPTIEVWPMTSIALPDFFHPWIHLVFFKLGILGAIFVLWFGQLIPQFLATSNPQKFLDWPGMGLALAAARGAESLGVTQPVDWMTQSADSAEKIPPSNKEIFFETAQNNGSAVVALEKSVVISAARVRIRTTSTIRVLSAEHETIVDDSLSFFAQHVVEGGDHTTHTLIRNGRSLDRGLLTIVAEDSFDEKSGYSTRRQKISLHGETFQRGDILHIQNEMELSSCEMAEITVKSPTHYMHFHLEIQDQPDQLKAPTMISHQWDAITNGFVESGAETRNLRRREGAEFMLYEQTVLYPKQFTRHRYTWTVTY